MGLRPDLTLPHPASGLDDPEWLALPEGPAKVAAVVRAAECWATEGDEAGGAAADGGSRCPGSPFKQLDDAEYVARRDAWRQEYEQRGYAPRPATGGGQHDAPRARLGTTLPRGMGRGRPEPDLPDAASRRVPGLRASPRQRTRTVPSGEVANVLGHHDNSGGWVPADRRTVHRAITKAISYGLLDGAGGARALVVGGTALLAAWGTPTPPASATPPPGPGRLRAVK